MKNVFFVSFTTAKNKKIRQPFVRLHCPAAVIGIADFDIFFPPDDIACP
jgi:hypothetical protein